MDDKDVIEFLNNNIFKNQNQIQVNPENYAQIINNFKFSGLSTGSSDSYFDD